MGRHTRLKGKCIMVHNGVEFVAVTRLQDRANTYDRPEGLPWTGSGKKGGAGLYGHGKFALTRHLTPMQSAKEAQRTRQLLAGERALATHKKSARRQAWKKRSRGAA